MAFPRIAAAAEVALVARDRRERPAHLGVVPRARRRPRPAVDEPRHRIPPLGRDPLGRPSEHDRPLGRGSSSGRPTSSTTRGCASTAAASPRRHGRRLAGRRGPTTVVDATAVAGPGALLDARVHRHPRPRRRRVRPTTTVPTRSATARALHRAHGTTRAVISLVTAPLETLERRAAMVADLVATDADILGSHLEGPVPRPRAQGRARRGAAARADAARRRTAARRAGAAPCDR